MSKIYPAAYMVRVQEEPGDPDLSPFTTHYVEKAEAEYLKRIHGDMAGVTPLYSSPPEQTHTGEREKAINDLAETIRGIAVEVRADIHISVCRVLSMNLLNSGYEKKVTK